VTPSSRFALAALAAALLGAAVVPGAPAGLGLSLVAVALAAAMVALPRGPEGRAEDAAGPAAAAVASGVGGAQPRVAHPLWSAGLGVLAVALAASATVRDAGWVVSGELIGAVVLGSVAMSAPRGWRATLLACVAAPLRMGSGVRFVASGAARALPSASGGQVLAVSRGLLLGGVLVAIFGALFATGDRAFAQLAGGVLPGDVPLDGLPLRVVTFGLVLALAGGLARATQVADESARRPLLRVGRSEWLMALGALNVLFALFVAVQLAVLFGGDTYVRETSGVTYAQYAREGFAQLVVVAILTLAVVAGALRWARTRTAAQARVLRALLATLCLLTLVVLASALHRLGLYEQTFGFTRTRLAVDAFLLFDAALFVLVVLALASDRRAWLPRATVVLTALAALAFWISDPDRRIATHNIERYESTGSIDVDYLSRLSADAVPALIRLPPRLRERVLRRQRVELASSPDGFAGANWSRARARKILAAP
jgi:hypothetical protein